MSQEDYTGQRGRGDLSVPGVVEGGLALWGVTGTSLRFHGVEEDYKILSCIQSLVLPIGWSCSGVLGWDVYVPPSLSLLCSMKTNDPVYESYCLSIYICLSLYPSVCLCVCLSTCSRLKVMFAFKVTSRSLL